MNTVLWVIYPYICLAIFVVGHFWRYKYDKFGWTTRSSQLYEDKLLRIGSPLFHFGMLGVIAGHVMGLLIPQSWTSAIGISPHTYHYIALIGGIPAGLATVAGLIILVYRRRRTGPVFSATTVNDKVMYLVLGIVILLGIWNTIAGSLLQFGGEYNYRDGVSPWFRSIFYFQPDAALMAGAPIGFQLHAFFAFLLFAMWPFTRLVHVFSAPIGYFTRPYIVYRSSDVRPGVGVGTHAPARGWDRPELQKKE
ncbi:respiratory nitrate reductase subunit gamma [Nostocoides sp. F2B08]|uniref:respiratory nitrate reductase subunit gamma n=1 Tax=Nostocoides sp. F2B08 TaxID=2653936 RepID=UPI001262F98D|nr:respiratory nitrate reductase subunit gamma [Tetrasphaera sp. F2B08]KAB7743861.1 respiratory nitrate reductase subunit gamma [Tetrasphaera sp. F2B08]